MVVLCSTSGRGIPKFQVLASALISSARSVPLADPPLSISRQSLGKALSLTQDLRKALVLPWALTCRDSFPCQSQASLSSREQILI